jgi:membrane protease YdiL (CAAX protease family)
MIARHLEITWIPTTQVRFAGGYLAAIAAAELLTALIHPVWGMLAHVSILAALLIHANLTDDEAQRALLQSLAIAPIIRIVSLGMPMSRFPGQWPYAIAAVPLLAATLVVIRGLSLDRSQLGLRLPRRRHWPITVAVAVSGLVIGRLEYELLNPEAIISDTGVAAIVSASIVLMLATGLVEELIFRGVLQATTTAALGTMSGIAYTSVLFGLLHIGHLSAPDVFFVSLVAVYFAWITRLTGSLVGVTLAHGLTNIALFIIFPLGLLPT